MSEFSFSCPVCGEDVPRKAKACPSCGACEKSGWSEDQYLDGIDLPDEDEGRDFEEDRRRSDLQRLWMVVAVVVLVAMVWLTLRAAW